MAVKFECAGCGCTPKGAGIRHACAWVRDPRSGRLFHSRACRAEWTGILSRPRPRKSTAPVTNPPPHPEYAFA